jgi:ferric-dicitrate binding protein FerR (iron transport regulator)
MHIDWQKQTLTVDNQSLTTVLDRLQRHYPSYLKYDQQALQSLTISGVFSLQNTQASLQLIATILPVSVEQYGAMVLMGKKTKPKPKSKKSSSPWSLSRGSSF